MQSPGRNRRSTRVASSQIQRSVACGSASNARASVLPRPVRAQTTPTVTGVLIETPGAADS